MPSRPTARSIDEYIAQFPPEARTMLEEMRAIIRDAAPEATETISYAIPTYDLNGHLVHFAGFKNHVSLFPTGKAAEAFAAEFALYKGGKGTVQFPIGKPLPRDLIRRVVEYRVEQNTAKNGQ